MTRDDEADSAYAMRVADESYGWYRKAAIRSRRAHRISAVAIQIVAASIPVSVAIAPAKPIITAILGAAIVLLSSLRAIFNWQEDYLRFSSSREAVEQERRRYRLGVEPYADPNTRSGLLAERVSAIERDEMSGWLKTVTKPRSDVGQASADTPAGMGDSKP
ncbi:DUF4231 domain-containing protein [Friedmanniella luteola]|uniref:DUF4231 domain-containing protein n=1 Tax=Friedmanniella luteola TaxID=546871 RepID=UPI000B883E5D